MVKFLSLAHAVTLIALAAASPIVRYQSDLSSSGLNSNTNASPIARYQSDLSSSGFNSNTNASPALKAALTGAASYNDRQAILFTNPPDATNITFTFINNTVTDSTGGTIALST
ncbi:hypothetical protein BGZ59_005142, partial [Podila verticillata]